MSCLGVYYRFLKETWEEWGRSKKEEPDSTRGLPVPPAEKPFSEDATLVDLTPPSQLPFGRMPVAQAIKQRRSCRQYTGDPLSLEELSFLLGATRGVQKPLSKGHRLHTVPAGSARHPFETYLTVHRVMGLEPGLYRYLALEHKLCLVYLDAQIAARARAACGDSRMAERSAVGFVWAAIPCRRVWHSLHQQHYAKDIALEAGHFCQNLYLACEAIGAGTCAVGGYLQSKLDALLGIDGNEEFAVCVAPVGKVRTGGSAGSATFAALLMKRESMSYDDKFNECERILAWWELGCVSSDDVVVWADGVIEDAAEGKDLPTWVIDLSLKGPKQFVSLNEPDHPRPRKLSYIERFRVMVETTNPDDLVSVCRFVRWIDSAALGEDIDLDEVRIGYRVGDADSSGITGDPVEISKKAIENYKPGCREIAEFRSVIGRKQPPDWS